MGSGSPTCPRTPPSCSRPSTRGPSSPGRARPGPWGLAPAEPLANQYFETLADLERAVAERCLVLDGDQLSLGTNFHWWPKPTKLNKRGGQITFTGPLH